jgi:hypothetical protein
MTIPIRNSSLTATVIKSGFIIDSSEPNNNAAQPRPNIDSGNVLQAAFVFIDFLESIAKHPINPDKHIAIFIINRQDKYMI